MTDLDRQIEEALDAEDRHLLEQFGEESFLGQALSVYRGKQAWIAMIATVAMLVIFAAAVYSLWRFMNVADAVSTMRWGAASVFFMLMVAFMKLWFWLRMESNRVLREIKRVELQLARMQSKTAS